MHLIHGTIQHYPWGSNDAIPALIGKPADGRPFAEYWLGAHPSSPSATGPTHIALDKFIRNRPEVLGDKSINAFGPQLSFLLKILSADRPLSIQTHPSRAQAEEGYARQDAEDIPLNSPRRTYRDTWPKPELLIALSEFHAFIGFRDPVATADLFAAIGAADLLDSVIAPLTGRDPSSALAEVFLDVLSLDEDRAHLVIETCAAAVNHVNDPGPVGDFARTAVELDEYFPGEPGILAALMLNRIRLQPGQTLFVYPGQLHAYLRGTGIEIMGNSDNVIRGGLTRKHIDIQGLVQVVEFSPAKPLVDQAVPMNPGLEVFRTPCTEFQAWRITPNNGPIELPCADSARIVLNLNGPTDITNNTETITLAPGMAVFIEAHESVTATGDGQLYLSASGAR